MKIAKGVIRRRKSKNDIQYNVPKEKDKCNDLQNTTQKTKGRATRNSPTHGGLTRVLRKDKQFLFHMLHPSCYSGYKASGKSGIRKGLDYDYD